MASGLDKAIKTDFLLVEVHCHEVYKERKKKLNVDVDDLELLVRIGQLVCGPEIKTISLIN